MILPYHSRLFAELPIIGIIRGITTKQAISIVQASLEAGMTNLEFTMNNPAAGEQIRESVALAGERINIGAGTVTTMTILEQALAAGASFIVTPVLIKEVVETCVSDKIPVFPGALSATEVSIAWDWGATMVKLFPAETFGPGYVKLLKETLPKIRLLPTGGVDLVSMEDFMHAGADGFGIGSPLFDRSRIEIEDWKWLKDQIVRFVRKYHSTRNGLREQNI